MGNENNCSLKQSKWHTITLDKLMLQLFEFMEFEELVKYKIIENFTNMNEQNYIVHNLEAEILEVVGERLIIFDDLEHKLKKDFTRVSNMFSIKSIIEVNDCWEDDCWMAYLKLKDGSIIVEHQM